MAESYTVSRHEMLYALDQADKFRLANVLVGEASWVKRTWVKRTWVKRTPLPGSAL